MITGNLLTAVFLMNQSNADALTVSLKNLTDEEWRELRKYERRSSFIPE